MPEAAPLQRKHVIDGKKSAKIQETIKRSQRKTVAVVFAGGVKSFTLSVSLTQRCLDMQGQLFYN